MGNVMEATMQEVLLIEKNLEFRAGIDRVWEAITDPEHIARWFPEQVEIDEFAVGQRGRFVWDRTECAGGYEFEIDELDPKTRVVWRWAKDAGVALEDTVQTTVEWVLSPSAAGGTRLHLRESGFVSEDDRQGNDGGWDKELGELAEYLDA